jgi:hypothetical protein
MGHPKWDCGRAATRPCVGRTQTSLSSSCAHLRREGGAKQLCSQDYSTVTLFAKLLAGRRRASSYGAMWQARSWRGSTSRRGSSPQRLKPDLGRALMSGLKPGPTWKQEQQQIPCGNDSQKNRGGRSLLQRHARLSGTLLEKNFRLRKLERFPCCCGVETLCRAVFLERKRRWYPSRPIHPQVIRFRGLP